MEKVVFLVDKKIEEVASILINELVNCSLNSNCFVTVYGVNNKINKVDKREVSQCVVDATKLFVITSLSLNIKTFISKFSKTPINKIIDTYLVIVDSSKNVDEYDDFSNLFIEESKKANLKIIDHYYFGDISKREDVDDVMRLKCHKIIKDSK